jgi:hypothetical protein
MLFQIVSVIFFAVIVMALLNLSSIFFMMFRLAKRAPTVSAKFAWLSTGSDELSAAYQRIYPGSRLPLLIRLTFWIFIAIVAIFVITILIKK